MPSIIALTMRSKASVVTCAEGLAPHEIVGKSEGASCKLDKHPTVKSEYWPGNPFFADRVTCTLP